MKKREFIPPCDYAAIAETRRLADVFRQRANGHIISYGLDQKYKAASYEAADMAERQELEQATFRNFVRSRRHANPDDVAFDTAEENVIALRVINLWTRVASRVAADDLKLLVPPEMLSPEKRDLVGRYALTSLATLMA